MPFIPNFVTCQRKAFAVYLQCFKLCLINITLVTPLFSCGIAPWHSIEQVPAEPASIAEIDAKAVTKSNNNLIEITLGYHLVKIYCDEAKGAFNSLEFSGEAKTLKFEAQIQRTYQVRCEPYSHWWIEDLENNNVVAGEKFN